MRAKDHPDTRIKAADARAINGAIDIARDLQALATERGFLALLAIRFHGRDNPPMALAYGWTPRDQEVLQDYGLGLCMNMAPAAGAARGMVLLGMHADGTAEIATYGVSRRDCDRLGTWGADVMEALPVCPFQTWWGWGKAGVPHRIHADQLATLSPQAQDFVKWNTHPGALAA